MLDGHAAMAEVDLAAYSNAVATTATALIYSVHLSVRCEATKRRDEIDAVIEHAVQTAKGNVPVIIAGWLLPRAQKAQAFSVATCFAWRTAHGERQIATTWSE